MHVATLRGTAHCGRNLFLFAACCCHLHVTGWKCTFLCVLVSYVPVQHRTCHKAAKLSRQPYFNRIRMSSNEPWCCGPSRSVATKEPASATVAEGPASATVRATLLRAMRMWHTLMTADIGSSVARHIVIVVRIEPRNARAPWHLGTPPRTCHDPQLVRQLH